ncbi:hypothetical protein BJ684DRAFT_20260 [Piptocephalis cylindrospora]|uniref:Uncharacterized protein n=1 Tax=Piptocephalis cylindrospora TaxID=1907219 RepID=A0A4P9Y302_9FUNG|nr:hypothetical protein BJ684DRAFT_20260 [Piptocephalis cylindrospora]|eukprot:RKP13235.1 hypothetical protein BJ684DRAFT_20260 [Piptocephalis cylindrospora]
MSLRTHAGKSEKNQLTGLPSEILARIIQKSHGVPVGAYRARWKLELETSNSNLNHLLFSVAMTHGTGGAYVAEKAGATDILGRSRDEQINPHLEEPRECLIRTHTPQCAYILRETLWRDGDTGHEWYDIGNRPWHTHTLTLIILVIRLYQTVHVDMVGQVDRGKQGLVVGPCELAPIPGPAPPRI